jgi:hypothetical protein
MPYGSMSAKSVIRTGWLFALGECRFDANGDTRFGKLRFRVNVAAMIPEGSLC